MADLGQSETTASEDDHMGELALVANSSDWLEERGWEPIRDWVNLRAVGVLELRTALESALAWLDEGERRA